MIRDQPASALEDPAGLLGIRESYHSCRSLASFQSPQIQIESDFAAPWNSGSALFSSGFPGALAPVMGIHYRGVQWEGSAVDGMSIT